MVLLAFVSMFVSLVLLVFLIFNKDSIRSVYLILLAAAIMFYLIGNYFELVTYDIVASKIALQIRMLGIPFIPTFWYLCVRDFCGLKFSKPQYAYFFWVVPLLIFFVSFFWESNHLLYQDILYPENNAIGHLQVVLGPLTPFRYLYQLSINTAGIITLIITYGKGTRYFKQQFFLFLTSAFIPFFNTLTYNVTIANYHIDITPYALLLSMLLFTTSLYFKGVLNSSHIIHTQALDNLPEGIFLFDKNGIVLHANQTAKELLPEVANLPIGTSIDEIPNMPIDSQTLFTQNPTVSHLHEFSKTIDGTTKVYSVNDAPIFRHRKLIGYSITFSNITVLKNSLNKLEVKSITDPLTGVYNRAYWFSRGQEFFHKAQLTGLPFCVIMLDVDFFKNVNDTYGHVFGDYVLKVIAKTCSSNLRGADIFARYGGEEFCILLETSLEHATNIADKLRLIIEHFPFINENTKVPITASFGVAEWSSSDQEFIDSVKRADQNLYRAKKTGRNKVC